MSWGSKQTKQIHKHKSSRTTILFFLLRWRVLQSRGHGAGGSASPRPGMNAQGLCLPSCLAAWSTVTKGNPGFGLLSLGCSKQTIIACLTILVIPPVFVSCWRPAWQCASWRFRVAGWGLNPFHSLLHLICLPHWYFSWLLWLSYLLCRMEEALYWSLCLVVDLLGGWALPFFGTLAELHCKAQPLSKMDGGAKLRLCFQLCLFRSAPPPLCLSAVPTGAPASHVNT